MSTLKEIGEGIYVSTIDPNRAIQFEMTGSVVNAPIIDTDKTYKKAKALHAKGKLWASWGQKNDLPYVLMSLVYNNNLLPGSLDTKDQITIGDKIIFYYERFEDGKIIPTPFEDIELSDWLEEIGTNEYLEEAAIDYNWFANAFAELAYGNQRGSKANKIVSIKNIEAVDCRAEIMDPKRLISLHYGIADWKNNPKDVKVVDAFDPSKDKQANKFIIHCKKKTPGQPYYPMPSYIGAQHWIRHANKIPIWKSANMDNAINIKYHVQIPERYFLNLYPDAQGYTKKDRQKKYEEKCAEIGEYLAGVENVSKAFFTQFAVDPVSGKELPGWKIEPIKNEINHEAYSKDFEDSNSAILSGVGVSPSLSGVMMPGKMGAGSGADIRLSYEFHSKVKTRYPRRILLKPIELAMKINGLDKRKVDGQLRKVKVGIQDMEFTTLDKNPTGSQKTL